MRRRLRALVLPVLILAAGVGVVAALVATRPETPSDPPGEPVRSVGAVSVVPGPHAPMVTVYGRLQSPSTTRLTAAVNADVTDVPVRDGQSFERGQLLVRLDDTDARLALRQRAADVADLEAQIAAERARHDFQRRAVADERRLLELADREVERQQGLAERNLSSAAAVDAALRERARQQLALTLRRESVATFEARLAGLEARLERARAARAEAARDLERTRIAAPFDGRVTEVEVAAGGRVRVGESLLTVFDTDALEVRATLPGTHVPAVREALAAGRPLAAVGRVDGRTIELRLARLAGRAEAGSAGVEAIFDVLTNEPLVALGRFVAATLSLPPVDGSVALPFEALYGTDRLYRVSDGRLDPVEVERLGETRAADGSARALVRSERLRPGDRVVTTQLPEATEGLRVRVVDSL